MVDYDAEMPTLGEAIKRFRKPLMNQKALAELMGVTQTTVSNWENNKFPPDAIQLVRLAACLKVPIQDLASGIDADYDKLCRDLLRHGNSVNSPNSSSFSSQGSLDASTTPVRAKTELRVAARLVKLSKQLQDLSTALVRGQITNPDASASARRRHS